MDRLLLTVGVITGDDSDITDVISLLSDSFFLMSFPPVLGRILACIGFAAVPTLGVTEVAKSLLLLSVLGPLPPVGGPLPPGGGPLPPGGGPLPPGGGSLLVSGQFPPENLILFSLSNDVHLGSTFQPGYL